MQPPGIGNTPLWIGFLAFVLVMLALDLGVFHRKAHAVTIRESLLWSAVWVALALAFNALVWWRFGSQAGIEFLTGYLIEKTLSVDNLFVFVVVFTAFGIPALHQHRVLFWGILGALIFRSIMIAAGAALISRFHWILYVFGAFLVLTAIKLYRERGASHQQESSLIRRLRTLVPATAGLRGGAFWVKDSGRRLATPLLLALLAVELTDIVFAVDSIPAIFAVTRDPFIVFTSNIFAILGLRSLYFLLASLLDRFVYLKLGLSVVLAFVGLKMMLADLVKVPAAVSLAVIAVTLAASILASLRATRAARPTEPERHVTNPA